MLSESNARGLLIELGAVAALREFDRQCAQEYAAQLLAQRCTRAQVRDRLMQRYRFSERSAYRCIDQAIQSANPAKPCITMAGGARTLCTSTNQLQATK